MGARLYVNSFSTKLTAQLLVAGTTANITTGDGATLAGANGTDWFIGTLRRMSGYRDVAREIVKITNRSTDALTIVRAQEGTTALQFEVGDQLDIDFTKTSLSELSPVTRYGDVALVSGGIPALVALNTQTGLTAALGTTTVYAVPADGFYEIMPYISITAAATSGNVGATWGWTDADTNVAVTTAGMSVLVTPTGSTLASQFLQGAARLVKAKGGTNITISTVFNSIVGTPTYNIYTMVRKL